MNFKIFYFLSLLIAISSCSKKISLEEEMNCSILNSLPKSSIRTDFKKNFSVQVPETWKYSLYYDDNQSSIYMADTIKQLLDTYIIDISKKNGELELNQEFDTKLDMHPDLQKLKSNFEKFKNLPAYWRISKGVRKNYTYHLFNLFVKITETSYVEVRIELYGEEDVDERLCESLSIINSLDINHSTITTLSGFGGGTGLKTSLNGLSINKLNGYLFL